MKKMSPHTMPSFMSNRSQRGVKAETKLTFTSLKDKMVGNTNIQGCSNDMNDNNYNKGSRPNP
jgi:hypothetical protein